jgi:hypothetical protein
MISGHTIFVCTPVYLPLLSNRLELLMKALKIICFTFAALSISCAGTGKFGKRVNMEEEVLRRAPFDLEYKREEIVVTKLGANTFGATGCGKKASYVVICKGGMECDVILNSDVE